MGFYLIGKGRPELERVAAVAHSASDRVRRAASRFPLLIYLGGITLIAVALAGSLAQRALAAGLPLWAAIPLGLVALLATSQLAVVLFNWLASLLVAPYPLPTGILRRHPAGVADAGRGADDADQPFRR